MTQEQQFKTLLPEIRHIVARRRTSWTLTTLAWEDVESILITRIYRQLPLYDVARPFENWANRLISNTMSNLMRDLLFKHERPCITASASGGPCSYNQGDERCGFTVSGKQCNECPLYAKWSRKKEAARNINSSLPLETHAQEVQNMQGDFLDIEAAKKVIDTKIVEYLNAHEAKVYRMLYIDHLSMEEVSKKMKYKTQSNSKVGQVLRKLIIRFKELSKEIIENENLA